MRTLTVIITFLALEIAVIADKSAPSQSDAEIRQKIVGTWIIDVGTTNGAYSAKGTVTYSTNGCYVAKARVLDGGKAHEERYEGLWHVEDGVLTDTVTNTVGIPFPQGNIFEHAKVLRVNENELVLESGKRIKHKEIEKRSK